MLPAANGEQQLKLAPVNPRTQVQLVAGPAGGDALAPLGLTEGIVTNPPSTSSSSSSSTSSTGSSAASAPTTHSYSLRLPSTLSLDSSAGTQAATTALAAAIQTVKSAYTVMSSPPAPTTPAGTVPAYLSDQLANYTAGLERLTGQAPSSSSSSSSSTSSDPNSYLLGLF